MKLSTLKTLIKNPGIAVQRLGARGLVNWISDEKYLQIVYRAKIGKKLDLDNPISFNEKLQWLKLHDRNPLYTLLVDKYLVKTWVAERIGDDHVVKTLASWDKAENIDIDALPDRFVLKTNHDSGGVVVCHDKNQFDLESARSKIRAHLKRNYYWAWREWPYRNIEPCVFAEEYLEPKGEGDLPDYKLMCFDGKVKIILVCTDRFKNDLRLDFYDEKWNHLPFRRHYPNANVPQSAPPGLSKMIQMAERLSQDIPFVRVDFYNLNGDIYFGEMTLYPAAGFGEFEPSDWDNRLGDWLDLSKVQERQR